MSAFLSDLRLAARSLARSPLLTTVAVATIALTVGLNTAVFSIVDAVVLRPLPFRDADRLVALCEADRGEHPDWCGASVPDVIDVAARSPSIAVAGAARSWPFVMRTVDGAEGVNGGLATPEAFHALGITPFAGRLIEPGDAGKDWRRVVVLGDEIWRSRFGARRDVIGRAIILDDEPHTIVGILPPGVRIPNLERVQMWRPLHFDPRDEERRDWRGFQAFARLRDGATIEQARREVAAIAADIQRDHFPAKPGWSIGVTRWHDVIVGVVRRAMYVFVGAVAFVLLIGCANVANLLLARAAARERELAVRVALGASRWPLARALLLESLVLAVAGAAAGLLLGWGASRIFVALAPAGIPRIEQVGLDPRALAYTAGLAALVTLLVGTVPALRATRVDPQRSLVEGGRGGTGSRAGRVGAALIVAEIALAVVLVTGAGLLARSFATLASWRPGFDQTHLLTAWTLASPGRFQTKRELADYFARAEDELRTIPSVVSVGTGSAGPLFGGDGEMRFTIDGRPASSGGPRQATLWYDIGPTYFRTIGLPIVRGRDIAATDVDGSPSVAVVNESFVRRYLAGAEPIGRRVHMEEQDADFTIVGVVRDVPAVRPGDPVEPQLFWPNRQIPRPATYFLVRTVGDPASVAAAVRSRLASYDRTLQVTRVRTLRDWLSLELVRPRFGAILLGTFGVLALLLAAIGTYGLLAYTVAQRTREIGIRMALGARPGAVVAEVLRRGMRLAAVAVAIGAAGALALTRLLAGLLAGVTPTDLPTFAASIALLLAAAALACLIPALRASRVDPMSALRRE